MDINNIINHKLYYFINIIKNIDININWFILLKINNNNSKLIISNTICMILCIYKYYKNMDINIIINFLLKNNNYKYYSILNECKNK